MFTPLYMKRLFPYEIDDMHSTKNGLLCRFTPHEKIIKPLGDCCIRILSAICPALPYTAKEQSNERTAGYSLISWPPGQLLMRNMAVDLNHDMSILRWRNNLLCFQKQQNCGAVLWVFPKLFGGKPSWGSWCNFAETAASRCAQEVLLWHLGQEVLWLVSRNTVLPIFSMFPPRWPANTRDMQCASRKVGALYTFYCMSVRGRWE